MVTRLSLSLFELNTEALRSFLLPGPQRCWDLLHTFIPDLAQKQSEKLMAELKAANETLSAKPNNVDEYVTFMSFLAKISVDFKVLLRRQLNIIDMFEIIKQYNIKIDPRLRSIFFEL